MGQGLTIGRWPMPPRQGATVNRSHALARGLAFFPLFGNGGMPRCLISETNPTTLGTQLNIGPNGGSFSASGTNNGWFEWSQSWIGSIFSSRTEITVAALYRSAGSNLQGSILTLANATGSAYTILGNNSAISWWPNSGGGFTLTGVSAYQTGLTYLMIGTGDGTATRATLWVNGGLVADTGSTAALGTLNASLNRIRVGNERGTSTGGAATSGYSPIGEVMYAGIWTRVMPLSEMAQLAANPYAFVNFRNPFNNPKRLGFTGWGMPR